MPLLALLGRGRDLLLAAAALAAGCNDTQEVYRCKACFRDSPADCGTYVGDCYGPYSKSMSARTTEEAQEQAAWLACGVRGKHWSGPPGPMPGCVLGPSYTEAQRQASLARFDFDCSTVRKSCP